MPLPPAHPTRTPRHVRSIRIEAFERDDGLWDLEASLTDVKPYAFQLRTGPRPAGQPVHDMKLRLTFDLRMNVVDVVAVSDEVPYPGHCETIGPDYRALVGLNLLDGFRKGIATRLGGIHGCTHMSELAAVLPTAAVQALAGAAIRVDDDERRPMQLDRCHALRTDGEAVRIHYPRWVAGVRHDAAAPAEVPAPREPAPAANQRFEDVPR